MHHWLRSLTPLSFCAALLLAGCIVAPTSNDDPSAPKDEGDDLPEGPLPSAYFTLNAADLRSENWPADWDEYTLFVCTPDMTAETVAGAKADRPDATFLAYTNAADLHLGIYSANPYWSSLEAVFDSSLCVTNLDTGSPVRIYPELSYFLMQKHTADILVDFHRDVTMSAGFDGLYLDNCTGSIPNWRMDELREQATRIDVDNDDFPDSMLQLRGIYETWRPYYTAQLRAAIGADAILIANSGGALGDSELNGITLEGVGDRFDLEAARAAFADQAAVGRAPFLGVGWVTTPASDSPTRGLVPEVPGLYYGALSTP